MGIVVKKRVKYLVVPFLVASISSIFIFQALARSSGPKSFPEGGVEVSMVLTTTTPTLTPSPTLTPTPTPTICPQASAVPFWVDPVLSPTDLLTQTIVIYSGASALTVTLETGFFTSTHTGYPALVEVNLNSNTTHHLTVSGSVPISGDPNGCHYGGYTLSTGVDRYGDPLTIVLVSSLQYFPFVRKNE
jgi:hypothetical protein